MNCHHWKVVVLLVTVFTLFTCSSGKKAQSNVAAADSSGVTQTIVPDTFVLPDIPPGVTNPDARAVYLVIHYWDRFDFADEKLIDRPEITEQAFVDYINILPFVPFEKAEEALRATMRRAEPNAAMYTHLGALFDKYLYDPNSPFRNEELYIPALQELSRSTALPEGDKSRYEFQLEMAMKNRTGDTATDFTWTDAAGQTHKLHSIKSEYLILMFTNPGCPTCNAAIRSLKNSNVLARAFAMNTPARTMLTLLTVYPDADIDEWRRHLPEMPPNWLHAYDDGMLIAKNRLYDIRAFPTLYLLDKDKKVIFKDVSVEVIEAFFSGPD